jgi:hypothetical protein
VLRVRVAALCRHVTIEGSNVLFSRFAHVGSRRCVAYHNRVNSSVRSRVSKSSGPNSFTCCEVTPCYPPNRLHRLRSVRSPSIPSSRPANELVEEPSRRFRRLALGRLFSRLYDFSARNPLERAYDATTMLSIVVYHHVLAAKYRWAPIGYDERYFLNEGWSVIRGLVPYRDFQDFKPPAIFFVNALGIELFGLDAMGYRRIFSILSVCGFLSLAIALLSRRTNRLLVGAVVALMIDHFFDDVFHTSSNSCINSAETLGLDFFMMGSGALLVRTKWERTQQFVGGALLALAPLSKEPMVFPVAAAWLAILLLCRIDSSRGDAARRFALVTIAGASAVAATWLVYMLATHSLGSYIAQLKLNIAYTKNYAYQVNWFPRNPKGGMLAESSRKLRIGYVNAAHIGVFIPFVIAPLALWGRRTIVGVAALATAAASLYAVSIGHGFCPRYFIMAMSGTFFCVVVGAIALDVYSKRAEDGMRQWVGTTWLAIALVNTGPRLADEWKKRGEYKPEPPPVSRSDVDFVRAHSDPGDKIWTTGDPLLYVYSDRVSAFRGAVVLDEVLEYYPGDTDEERVAMQREGLLMNRPKLVVFNDEVVGAHRKQRYVRALVMPFLRDGGYIELSDRFYLRPDGVAAPPRAP